MSLRARRPLIILFVLGAMALGVVMVYFFGGRDKISRHDAFLVYFNDNINGLVPGSLVRFKGVPVGYVDAVRLDYRQPGEHNIPVRILLNADRLQRQLGVLEDLGNPEMLARQLQRGLRAELDTESYVTGQMFVELEYHTPAPPYPLVSPPAGLPPIPVIPAIPSAAVADLKKIQDIITWLPTFDFRSEIEKSGREIDSLTTAVVVIPYAESSQRIQQLAQPLARFNFGVWQRNFDNFLNRLNRYQYALNDANENFYAQSQDFVAMNRKMRGDLGRLDTQLKDARAVLQSDNPSLAHVLHNLDQLTKDLTTLTRKLNAKEDQPEVVDKLAH